MGNECGGNETADDVSIVYAPVRVGAVELVLVNEKKTREGAEAKCHDMAGKLARYEVAPEKLIELAKEYGELHVVEDSNGRHNPVLDQSNHPPCIDSVIDKGFCSCCLYTDSQKKFVCCLGDECGSDDSSAGGGKNSAAAALATVAAAMASVATAVVVACA